MQDLIDHLNQLDPSLKLQHGYSIGGGCISQAYRIKGNTRHYFLKVNSLNLLSMFEAEFLGLEEIHKTESIKTPQPYRVGKTESQSYILMEDCPMGGRGDWREMGRSLANMHQYTHEYHGWVRDNTIGATPQINTQTKDWLEFFKTYRLAYQVNLARDNGLPLVQADQLLDNLDRFFDDMPKPSLLHGDLWSGNADFSKDLEPIIFDPATHYGDRECDLAMTELFGGFSSEFYQGYDEIWAIDKGYKIRKDLYQLYHILNHYNLFGGGYGSQSEHIISRLINY